MAFLLISFSPYTFHFEMRYFWESNSVQLQINCNFQETTGIEVNRQNRTKSYRLFLLKRSLLWIYLMHVRKKELFDELSFCSLQHKIKQLETNNILSSEKSLLLLKKRKSESPFIRDGVFEILYFKTCRENRLLKSYVDDCAAPLYARMQHVWRS